VAVVVDIRIADAELCVEADEEFYVAEVSGVMSGRVLRK
jgi:hypothetical protein